MPSVDQQASGVSGGGPVAGIDAQLEGVSRLAKQWLDRSPPPDPFREQVIRMGILAQDLARHRNYSPTALTTVRAMLCTTCRRLDAAHGECSGQSLDRCPLIAGTQH